MTLLNPTWSIYVAATFGRYPEARAVIDALSRAGHTVTFDWTRTDAFDADGDPIIDGYDLPVETQARHAQAYLDGIVAADYVFALGAEASCGWLIEVGYGLALSRRVVVVDPFRDTVFWSLPGVKVFDDLDVALAAFGASL